jgi:hyperosmotically inducible periplasmic protein
MMTPFRRKPLLLLLASLATLFALGACDRGEPRVGGQALDPATSRAKEEAQDEAARAHAAATNAGDSAKSMGAAAAGKSDDAAITSKVNAALAADKDLSASKIDVDTKDGRVTLNGPAPSARARDRATDIARDVKGVNSVKNNLTVKAG